MTLNKPAQIQDLGNWMQKMEAFDETMKQVGDEYDKQIEKMRAELTMLHLQREEALRQVYITAGVVNPAVNMIAHGHRIVQTSYPDGSNWLSIDGKTLDDDDPMVRRIREAVDLNLLDEDLSKLPHIGLTLSQAGHEHIAQIF